MKKILTLLFILCLSLRVGASYYIVGNPPFGGWQTNAGLELTAESGTLYSATAEVSGTVYFVVANADCNKDGGVTTADVEVLVQYLLSKQW